jgi:hypothetical protein
MARPRSKSARRYLYGAWSTPDDLGPITDIWETFPLGALWAEQVPEWATHVSVHASITGLLHPDTTAAAGELRVTFGEQHGPGMPYAAAQAGRLAVQAGNRFLINPADRGEVMNLIVEGIGASGSTGVLRADASTVLSIEVTYEQAPVSA